LINSSELIESLLVIVIDETVKFFRYVCKRI